VWGSEDIADYITDYLYPDYAFMETNPFFTKYIIFNNVYTMLNWDLEYEPMKEEYTTWVEYIDLDHPVATWINWPSPIPTPHIAHLDEPHMEFFALFMSVFFLFSLYTYLHYRVKTVVIEEISEEELNRFVTVSTQTENQIQLDPFEPMFYKSINTVLDIFLFYFI
jgi:hypothetical protein